MEKNSNRLLKALLDQVNESYQKELSSYLSPSIQSSFDEKNRYIRLFTKDPLNEIHYSWYLPILKNLKHPENLYFLMALDDSIAFPLETALKLTRPTVGITDIFQHYLKQILREQMIPKELLPFGFLPDSPFLELASASKKELIDLIHRLSLFDLASEMRQIVETKILKKIYSSLTEDEKNFLNQRTFEKENVSWPKMGLEKWDGTKVHLHTILHRRGIYRLSLAIQNASFEIRWYMSHKLDLGRGSFLMKIKPVSIAPSLKERMIDQVLQVFKEIKS